MKINLEIPDFDGNALDVIWDNDAEYRINVSHGEVVLSANKQGLISLAKQMLYMAYQDLPTGSHVHYDDFFVKSNASEFDLVIVKKQNISEGV